MAISEPITKANLERITNGIFAFTMTLLARDIVTPGEYTQAALITFDQFSLHTIGSIIDFVGVFILLAMFWMLFFLYLSHPVQRNRAPWQFLNPSTR